MTSRSEDALQEKALRGLKEAVGFTPGPMRVVTAVEVSANAVRRWRDQYRDWRDDDRFFDGQTKKKVNDALNSSRHTPENITRILNEGWAKPQCRGCGRYQDFVVDIQEHFGEGADSYCSDCLSHACALLSAARGEQ